jgi:iron(II)-dependent oxidoreductase
MSDESMNASFRTARRDDLNIALRNARDYTLALFDRFEAAGLDDPARVPVIDILNPPLWEIGHIAWFAEWYILREATSSAPDAALRGSMLTLGDAWFDSNAVSHASRWHLGLPRAGALKTYCREVLDRVLDKLGRTTGTDEALYPYRLVLAHEDMHGEAFLMAMQSLGIAPAEPAAAIPGWAQGSIWFPGGSILKGSGSDSGFAFDNEKPATACRVPSFEISSTLVSNAEFSEFIADSGYETPRFWTEKGRAWLMERESSAPAHWTRDGQTWLARQYDTIVSLPPHQPVRHVSLYEAQAWCVWAERRLPTEEEWEYAALSGHPAFRWGDLWEWTCSAFEPYPGFAPDAYREYSAPWFGTHQSVRGASFATRPRMRSAAYRNFYLPERNDMFVGFRSCAL